MLKVLYKPYPCNRGIVDNLIISVMVSVFVLFFLFFFEPFSNHINYNTSVVVGYALITFFVGFFLSTILPILFPRSFEEKTWTVGKEILYICFIVFTIGVANFFFAGPFEIHPEEEELFTIPHFFLSITITFVVGIMPVIIVVLYNQTRLLNKYMKESEKMNTSIEKSSQKLEQIILIGEGKNEKIVTQDKSILFIKSESNYCEVHLKDNESFQKILLRISLSSLEKELLKIESFARVHRSYIVNYKNIERVTGTAQGYKLHFNGIDETVPVSRKKSAYFKSLIA